MTDEEWDGKPDDSIPEEVLYGTAPVQNLSNPCQNDENPHFDGVPRADPLLGFGAETVDSVPFIVHH